MSYFTLSCLTSSSSWPALSYSTVGQGWPGFRGSPVVCHHQTERPWLAHQVGVKARLASREGAMSYFTVSWLVDLSFKLASHELLHSELADFFFQLAGHELLHSGLADLFLVALLSATVKRRDPSCNAHEC